MRSAAAAGQMQPLVLEENDGHANPIDEAEIKSEAMAVGLIAADRLASLLLHNSEVGPRPGLKVSFPKFWVFPFCSRLQISLRRWRRKSPVFVCYCILQKRYLELDSNILSLELIYNCIIDIVVVASSRLLNIFLKKCMRSIWNWAASHMLTFM